MALFCYKELKSWWETYTKALSVNGASVNKKADTLQNPLSHNLAADRSVEPAVNSNDANWSIEVT